MRFTRKIKSTTKGKKVGIDMALLIADEKAKKIDEIQNLMNEIGIDIDELKDYLNKGYESKKIGFLD